MIRERCAEPGIWRPLRGGESSVDISYLSEMPIGHVIYLFYFHDRDVLSRCATSSENPTLHVQIYFCHRCFRREAAIQWGKNGDYNC